MKVIIFGSSGMVGGGILRTSLGDPRVESVLSVGRRSSDLSHPKLHEMIVPDLFELEDRKSDLAGYDACFFCIGVSSVGMSESEYRSLTLDLTVGIAAVVGELNPGLTFCYLSAVGSDTSGSSRWMWARVRGETENRLFKMPFPAYSFRPGYIQPWKGVPSKTKGTRWMYNVLGPFFPILNRLFPDQVTTTERMGRAMIHIAGHGYKKNILMARDMNELARADGST